MHLPKIGQAASRGHRGLFEIAAAAGLTIAGFFGVPGGPAAPVLAQGADVAVDELMASEVLPDVALGASGAPVTIVEYASMTCVHCAGFYAATFPELKSKYIDTGKVRFILREFPLDPLAAAGFMLARCAGDDKRNAIVDLLFAQQKNWAFTDKPLEALGNLLKQTGMSQNSFEACLKNQDLYDKIAKVHDRAAEKFGVTATPTFFINGKRQKGEITSDALEKLLDPLLKG
ncbi:MAG: DsbA family protein [Pseudomonadota bacterium]|nr:DsbA family protein [Pseudomonadota bacterium]